MIYRQGTGTTYASSKGAQLRYKISKYRRERYLQAKRDNPIARRIFGRSITAKLTKMVNASITAISDWDTVYGLSAILQSSNDWPYYRDSYGMFNILHVTVKVYPQAFPFSSGIDRIAGLCYDLKDNVAAASLQTIADHKQHLVMNFSANGADHYKFATSTKPIGVTPQSTSSANESWGWIKAFGDNADFGAGAYSICRIEFIFSVAFSSEQ